MEVALTWNLVILSVFVLLFAYSFMLGQDETIKLILCIYIAILAADGVAGGLQEFIIDPSPGFQTLLADKKVQILSWMRMGLFVLAVVIFAVKSGFQVHLEKHERVLVRFAIHSWFSAMSALLFLSTMLIYLSGNSFVEGMLFAKEISIYEQSLLAQALIDYYQLWFAFPAMSFLVTSFLFEKKEKF